MKVQDYFDSKKRESARLVQELAEHMATWPAVIRQFDEIDEQECIPLARKWNDAKAAGSPKVVALEADLKQARWRRDGLKRNFGIRRDELVRQIESFTREPISKFHLEALDLARNIAKLYRYQRLEPAHDMDGKRRRATVRITHNTDALIRAKDLIFERIKEVQGMNLSPLADVKQRIAEIRQEFFHLDTSTMQIEEIEEHREPDYRPTPDTGDSDKGMLLPGGGFHIHPPKADAARINNLSDRLSKLEKAI
jgi:hypothetical protein